MTPQNRSFQTLALTALAGAVAALSAMSAHAAEGRAQRYSPGVGGSDMTASLAPGWYAQAAVLHYHATKLKNNEGNEVRQVGGGQAVTTNQIAGLTSQASGGAISLPQAAGFANAAFGANGINYTTNINNFRTEAYVILPRVTFLSTTQVLGANIGFTAMVPIVQRQTSIALGNTFTPAAPTPLGNAQVDAIMNGINQNVQGQVNAGSAAQAESRSATSAGFGDLELGPVMLWSISDNQSVIFSPTVVLPTGPFDADKTRVKAANTGFGDYYTFRPSIQYGYVGDGWDVGARAVFSFNTRNKDTDYKTGHIFNLDYQLMKFVTDDLRLGLQGYVVQQFSRDDSKIASVQAEIDAANGAKMRTFAAGPAVAWIVNGGEALIEGKVLKEFGSRNRAEGMSYWLMVSKPLGL